MLEFLLALEDLQIIAITLDSSRPALSPVTGKVVVSFGFSL